MIEFKYLFVKYPNLLVLLASSFYESIPQRVIMEGHGVFFNNNHLLFLHFQSSVISSEIALSLGVQFRLRSYEFYDKLSFTVFPTVDPILFWKAEIESSCIL